MSSSKPLYDQFNFSVQMGGWAGSQPITDPLVKNMIAASQRLSVFCCPSDPQAGELCDLTGGTWPGHPSDPREDVAMSNMAGVNDSVDTYCGGHDEYRSKQLVEADGVLANMEPCDIAQITDGTSNTLMIGEMTGGGAGSHIGLYWFNFAVYTTARGINGPGSIPGGVNPASFSWFSTSFSSYHPGGCNFAMADGSVTFVSQNIDQNLLNALATRAGKRSNGQMDTVLVSGPP